MKTFVKMFVVLFVITSGTLFTPQKASAQAAISYQVFYDQLSPYGSWVSYPNYGYVWLPNAGQGFSPYATAGHWVFTEFGWTWVSDYKWGWAAFHYGRWMFDPYYGWLWVPDTVWGPAWVIWRSSPGYYGWAPLRPGISINVAFGPGYYIPNDWWVFAPCHHINSVNIYNYYAPRSNNVTIIKNTTIINRTYVDESQHITYSYGPDRDAVQKATGIAIKPVTIKQRDTPGESVSNGQLSIYKPRIQKTYANGNTPAPTKVTELKEIKKRDVANEASSPGTTKTLSDETKQTVPVKQAPAQQREVKQPRTPAEPQRKQNEVKPQPKQMNTSQWNVEKMQTNTTAQAASTVKKGNYQQAAPIQSTRSVNEKSSGGQLYANALKPEKNNLQQVNQPAVVAPEKRKQVNKDHHER
ncbi:MAG: DUF6600 domain-containing protein [Chitinophagales bacterium]